MTTVGDGLRPADERLCPTHRRALAAYEQAASNRAAVMVPLCIWLVAWLACTLNRPSGISTMLELVSYVAFWGGFVTRMVYIIWRLGSLFHGFLSCQPCRVHIQQWNSANRR